MIYKTFEQWKSGNVLEHGVPRTEYYSEDQLDLVEMGWNYGYDAGRAVEQALDKKAENARELGLDYEPVQDVSLIDEGKTAAQPAPVQEPVAYEYGDDVFWHDSPDINDYIRVNGKALVYATPPAQPAVPDAMTSADIQEHIEYVAGWNDCRAEMLKGMKP
jgi:hypothetical protein